MACTAEGTYDDQNVIPPSAGCHRVGLIIPAMNRAHVLIVEDDRTTQHLARIVLQDAGYNVSAADNAEQAATWLEMFLPDVILMDRELPGMDGLELTRRIKMDQRTSGATVLSFSSRQTPADDMQAVSAGSDGFVNKPFDVHALLRTIAWHVAARSTPLGDAAQHLPPADRRSGSPSNPSGGTMKFSRTILSAALMVVGIAAVSAAQTATQTVTFQVDAINQISVAGSPSLNIIAGVAGGAPTSVTSTGNTWAVTTNQSNAKITASIASAMPSGLTLSVNLGAPAGASSAGSKTLGTSAVDVVTGITKLNATGLSMTYQLDATAAAGVVSSSTRVVTYTVTGGA
jgi:DNA-binding response OmpR family regulator